MAVTNAEIPEGWTEHYLNGERFYFHAASNVVSPTLPETTQEDALEAAAQRAARLVAAEQRASNAAAGRTSMDEWRAAQRQAPVPPPAPTPREQVQLASSTPAVFAEQVLAPPALRSQAMQLLPAQGQEPQVPDAHSSMRRVLESPLLSQDPCRASSSKTSCARLALVFCCLTNLVFSVAVLVAVSHKVSVHVPGTHHTLPRRDLLAFLTAASLFCALATVAFAMKHAAQRGQRTRSKGASWAVYTCLFIGVTLIALGVFILVVGQRHPQYVRHLLHFGRHLRLSRRSFREIAIASLGGGGLLLITACALLRRAKVRSSTQASRCGKRAHMVCCLAVGLIVFSLGASGIAAHMSHRRHSHRLNDSLLWLRRAVERVTKPTWKLETEKDEDYYADDEEDVEDEDKEGEGDEEVSEAEGDDYYDDDDEAHEADDGKGEDDEDYYWTETATNGKSSDFDDEAGHEELNFDEEQGVKSRRRFDKTTIPDRNGMVTKRKGTNAKLTRWKTKHVLAKIAQKKQNMSNSSHYLGKTKVGERIRDARVHDMRKPNSMVA